MVRCNIQSLPVCRILFACSVEILSLLSCSWQLKFGELLRWGLCDSGQRLQPESSLVQASVLLRSLHVCSELQSCLVSTPPSPRHIATRVLASVNFQLNSFACLPGDSCNRTTSLEYMSRLVELEGTVTVKWRRKRLMEGATTALQVPCLTLCKSQSHGIACQFFSLAAIKCRASGVPRCK